MKAAPRKFLGSLEIVHVSGAVVVRHVHFFGRALSFLHPFVIWTFRIYLGVFAAASSVGGGLCACELHGQGDI